MEWRRFDELSAALLYEVLRFRQAIFVVEQRCAYPDLDGLDQRAEHLLARNGEALVGYLRLILQPAERRVAIGRVAVAPTSRRRGLAGSMMRQALTRCAGNHPGCTVTLSAQTYLAPFYERLGFRASSAPYDDYGIPHVEMTLLATASKKSLVELLKELEPIDDEIPEIEDPPPDEVNV